MVRLGITSGSRGSGGEGPSHHGLPPPEQRHYSYPVIRADGGQRNPQQILSSPSTSSQLQLQLNSRLEALLPPETSLSPIHSQHDSSFPTAAITPIGSASSSAAMSNRALPSGWSRTARNAGESVIKSQKRPYRETEEPSELYANDIKWCPVCRSPVHANAVHHCPSVAQHGLNLYGRSGAVDKTQNKIISSDHANLHLGAYSDSAQHRVSTLPEQGLTFSGRIPSLRVPMPSSSSSSSISPHSISPSTSQPHRIIPQDHHSPSTSNPPPTLRTVPAAVPLLDPLSRTPPPSSSTKTDPLTTHRTSSSEKPSQPSPSWSAENYNQPAPIPADPWETPTSLISRLTAGLTRSGQQDDKNYRGCPSPSMSETSSISMSSSYYNQESAVPDDPFNMAHQELVDEFSKHTAPPIEIPRPNMKSNSMKNFAEKRGRRYTSSESASSDMMHGGDSNLYGSQDSDSDDNSMCGYLDDNGKLPDLDTLLKSIKEPDLTPYLPDKSSIERFLDPHEIGHINHLIKSVSDAMLTISLPETLYKSKGFTPLDYMDIHLNCVIRHFFFVYKNEDFLNLVMPDQIALLDGCTLRAIQCTSLYLFNKEAGCWHIPGATSEANHPVIHVSDLLQVFPQDFVSRTFELHTIAAKLGFDWPMGVIASCVLMYTPLKRVIQEMDKVDVLRNKYVSLLLKYVTWKHGTYNASLLFPQILKLLDALLLHVEDFATITLNLNEEEVVAVEERLATVTLSQMAPFGCHSSKFKEKVASWSSLDNVKLGDIQNKLCMAMHVSMLESLKSTNTEYWTSNSDFDKSREEQIITKFKPLPQLMPISDKEYSNDQTLERSAYLNQKMLQHQSRDMKSISALAHKDLMMLRKFLEEVTNREGTLVVQNIKEKMDSNQIKKVINKLCS